MPQSWIIYAPQGVNKSRKARAIANVLWLSNIVNEWDGRQETFRPMDTLHITETLPEWVTDWSRVLSFSEAIDRLHRGVLAV